MAATLLDGNALAATVKADLEDRVAVLATAGVTPGLGTILVGDDPNSHAYVRLKRQDSAEIGIRSIHTELPGDATQADLDAVIAACPERTMRGGVRVIVDRDPSSMM